MNGYLRNIKVVYFRDLKQELRGLDEFLSMVVFGVMLVFITSFAFQLTDVDTSRILPAVLWVTIFFASELAVQRSFAREKERNAIDALLMALDDKSVLFYAKALANFTILLVFGVIILPVLWIFCDVSLRGVNLWLLVFSLVWGSWGLAAVGTMLTAMTVQLPNSRLLPILMFPLLIPLFIAVVRCTDLAILGVTEGALGWVYFVSVYDLLFSLLPLILFEFVLEG